MDQRDEAREGRRQREDLTGEHRLGDAGQMVLAIVFAIVWVGDTFFVRATTWLNHYGSTGLRMAVGFAILALSAYLSSAGLRIVFGERRATPGVIRTGVFGLVRHPIYLSEILLYLGLLVLSTSLAAAVIWVAAIAFLHTIARYEERLLLTRFGEDYARYQREVGMWLPRLRRG